MVDVDFHTPKTDYIQYMEIIVLYLDMSIQFLVIITLLFLSATDYSDFWYSFGPGATDTVHLEINTLIVFRLRPRRQLG